MVEVERLVGHEGNRQRTRSHDAHGQAEDQVGDRGRSQSGGEEHHDVLALAELRGDGPLRHELLLELLVVEQPHHEEVLSVVPDVDDQPAVVEAEGEVGDAEHDQVRGQERVVRQAECAVSKGADLADEIHAESSRSGDRKDRHQLAWYGYRLELHVEEL